MEYFEHYGCCEISRLWFDYELEWDYVNVMEFVPPDDEGWSFDAYHMDNYWSALLRWVDEQP